MASMILQWMYVDASEAAVAAVCYVVQRQQDRVVRALVMSKCLVAPIKTKSIPCLELDAAVLGVRLWRIVTKANRWQVNRTVFWTDAKDVLWWLKSSTRRYTPYVANRVSNILSETSVEQWRWTPTNMNPADWGTKWLGPRKDDRMWWFGPDYLEDDDECWPECIQEATQVLEVRPVLLVKELTSGPVTGLPDLERFSRWLLYRNATAIVLKVVAIMKKRTFPGPLNAEDIQRAESAIFRAVQVGLATSKEHRVFLSSLAPFLDQWGVLRMRGRAARAENLHMDARFPVIVVGSHPAVVLLIQHYHHVNGHQNTSTVVNELRQKIIMPHMKSTVRRVISMCRLCAVRRARPIVPQMSALPLTRLALHMPCFSYVGIDYFGPYDVVIGRRHEKRWGVLMTCLTTRAVYLELAFSLSTKSCIAVLDSLVTRRGMPLEFHSDNGTCFVGAAKEFVGPHGQKPIWRFIPPRCPSMGGAWERLVGVTKRALDALLFTRTPTEEGLRRALLIAERLANARPLTDIPMDPEEEECLTPNHFLLGSSMGIKPKMSMTEWEPKKSLEAWNEIVDSFWTRFTSAYLPLISVRTTDQEKTDKLKEGDLVFLCDTDYRHGWIRARVTKVLEDKESGQVRQVVVRTADGKEYRRASRNAAPILLC